MHEEVDLFVHTLLSALERSRPGYLGKVIGEVFAAVHASYYDEAEAFRRIRAASQKTGRTMRVVAEALIATFDEPGPA